jgi:hypothetical protein
MRFSRQEITRICREFGPLIEGLPDDIDGAQLLWAIAGNESSFGINSRSVYEPAYGPNGRYHVQKNWERFGKLAASSLGPWQLMFVNCPPGYTPDDMIDLQKAAAATVWFMNNQLRRFKPTTLASIGAIWNGGNPHAHKRADVTEYIKKLERNYRVPMELELIV